MFRNAKTTCAGTFDQDGQPTVALRTVLANENDILNFPDIFSPIGLSSMRGIVRVRATELVGDLRKRAGPWEDGSSTRPGEQIHKIAQRHGVNMDVVRQIRLPSPMLAVDVPNDIANPMTGAHAVLNELAVGSLEVSVSRAA